MFDESFDSRIRAIRTTPIRKKPGIPIIASASIYRGPLVHSCESYRPFALNPSLGDLPRFLGPRWIRASIERLLGFPRLNALYGSSHNSRKNEPFVSRVLEALRVQIELDDAEIKQIPRSGPLVVVANHPFGGVDGLALAAILRRIRPDARILANKLLRVVPELHESMYFVDPFDQPESVIMNFGPIRSSIRWVQSGGALGVFPAGEVSHSKPMQRTVTDPQWSSAAARIIRLTGAAVIPMYFEGCNSLRFQLAGWIHPRLRTLLLPRELLSKADSTLRVRVGQPITPSRWSKFIDDTELTAYLRLRTYMLRKDVCNERLREPPARIAPAIAIDRVVTDIETLPTAQRLVESGSFMVVQARAQQIPAAMREIGRLRERAFREVGEGTGNAFDLDRFDEHYVQLILWNRQRREIVGGYRLGPTDEILPRFGDRGLYTSTLFRYQKRLLDQINPALELGRSFVRGEYQRSYGPLMLLWKGIGRFVAANPRYRRLFGPVSISGEYQSMSRQLLIAFLKSNRFLSSFSRLISPHRPPRFRRVQHDDASLLAVAANDVEEIDEIVREIEADRRCLPVLLRQYLKLNAKLLGFNVDPHFGDALDGLMFVDLMTVDRRLLNHYMGSDSAQSFLRHHADKASRSIRDQVGLAVSIV